MKLLYSKEKYLLDILFCLGLVNKKVAGEILEYLEGRFNNELLSKEINDVVNEINIVRS